MKLFLILFLLKIFSSNAVCTPDNKADLVTLKKACLVESADGNCLNHRLENSPECNNPSYELWFAPGHFIHERNGLIGTWDTSKVESMDSMFSGNNLFNQDISGWNTGQVTNMYQMFYQASAFNHSIGTWNTGQVTTMASMFNGASAFNQDIGSWNT